MSALGPTLLPSGHILPAIRGQRRARDEARVVRSEEHHAAGNLVCLAQTTGGNGRDDLVADLLGHGHHHLGRHIARADGVHGHALARAFLGQRLGEAQIPGLGGGIIGLGELAFLTVDRGYVDDATKAALDKVLPAYWSHANPVDILGDADPATYAAAVKAAIADTDNDGVLVMLTPQAMTDSVATAQAVVGALRAFPKVNSSIDMDAGELILKDYYNIGVAVDTPKGLVVPVIRNCDQKNVLQVAAELTDLAERARDRKMKSAEMRGASFTITNLGGIGGTAFTPIVNWPEVAILGVSRSDMQPAWDGEQFQPRLMLPLSLSYDHRVIDGADAARFTTYLSQLLTDMRRALL